MGKKSQPKAPDPAATAAAQSQANKEAVRESAKVNAVDQYGPWGSTTYQRNGDGTPASQTVALTDQGQRIFNGQQNISEGLVQKAGELASRIPTGPMDISNLPARQTSIGTNGLPALSGAVQAPRMQMGVPSRSGELVRDMNSRSGELTRSVDARTGEVSNLGTQGYGAQTKATQDATFGKAQALLQPGQQLERSRLQQSLSDRGIPLDSAAGRAEITRMDRAQSEANNRSAYDAVAAGSAEQSRLFGLDATRTQINNSAAGQRFGQDLSAGQFRNAATGQAFGQDLATNQFKNSATESAFNQDLQSGAFRNSAAQQLFGMNTTNAGLNNAARAQGFNERSAQASFNNDQRNNALTEALMLRNQNLNEASALLQGAPVMGMPQFQQNAQYNVAAPDIMGATQANYAQRSQAASQAAGNFWGGVTSLGGAALFGLSDRRLKKDVRPVGYGPLGLIVYVFRYLWGSEPQIGFMADEVRKVLPEAVVTLPGGFDAANYGLIARAAR